MGNISLGAQFGLSVAGVPSPLPGVDLRALRALLQQQQAFSPNNCGRQQPQHQQFAAGGGPSNPSFCGSFAAEDVLDMRPVSQRLVDFVVDDNYFPGTCQFP